MIRGLVPAALIILFAFSCHAQSTPMFEMIAKLGEPGFRLTGPIEGVTFSPKGDLVAGWSNGTEGSSASLRVWLTNSRVELFRTSERRVSFAKFSSDGKRLLAGTRSSLAVFDLTEKTPLFSLNKIDTTKSLVCLSSDGTCLYVAIDLKSKTKELELRCYELESANLLFQRKLKYSQCCTLAFHPHRDEIAVLGSSSLCFLEGRTGRELSQAIDPKLRQVTYSRRRPIALFSPSGRYILCADRPCEGNENGRALIFDGQSRKLVRVLSGKTPIFAAAFDENELELTVSTLQGIQRFDLKRDIKNWEWSGKGDGSIQSRERDYAYRPKDRTIFASQLHKGLIIQGCEKEEGALLTKLTFNEGDEAKQDRLQSYGRLQSVAISRNGRYAALGGDNHVLNLFDLTASKCIPPPSGHLGKVTAIALSPKGDYAFTGSQDGSVRLWHMNNQNCVGKVGRHQGQIVGLSFSPDGRELASLDTKGLLRRWSVPEMKSLGTAQIENSIQAARFVSGASLLGVAREKGEIVIYENIFDGHQTTLRERRQLASDTTQIDNLCMCHAGMTVSAVGDGSPVFVWRPKSGWVLSMLEWTRGKRYCALSPSGRTLACSSRASFLLVADPHTSRMLFVCPTVVESTVMHFLSENKLLCVGAGGKATILTLKRYPNRRFTKALELSHKETLRLDIPAPSAITSSVDGRLIAFGLFDSTAAVFRVNGN